MLPDLPWRLGGRPLLPHPSCDGREPFAVSPALHRARRPLAFERFREVPCWPQNGYNSPGACATHWRAGLLWLQRPPGRGQPGCQPRFWPKHPSAQQRPLSLAEANPGLVERRLPGQRRPLSEPQRRAQRDIAPPDRTGGAAASGVGLARPVSPAPNRLWAGPGMPARQRPRNVALRLCARRGGAAGPCDATRGRPSAAHGRRHAPVCGARRPRKPVTRVGGGEGRRLSDPAPARHGPL
mmetsp:Transcript_411/g.1481  ORF Transcript_411/g.1481 Transcript_411/m.1481 type:complete len:239 (+) Transcript_411:290-1006(+)